MVLLHEDDNHFNLVISEDSDLAKHGSLSYRFNICPPVKKTDDAETSDKVEDKTDEDFTEVDQLKKEP